MARAVEADRVAVFFQEAAPSLWVEALRCQSSAVSSNMYHQASTIAAAAIGIVSGVPPAVVGVLGVFYAPLRSWSRRSWRSRRRARCADLTWQTCCRSESQRLRSLVRVTGVAIGEWWEEVVSLTLAVLLGKRMVPGNPIWQRAFSAGQQRKPISELTVAARHAIRLGVCFLTSCIRACTTATEVLRSGLFKKCKPYLLPS